MKLDELVAMLSEVGFPGGPPEQTTFAEIEAFGHQMGRLVSQTLDQAITQQHAEHFEQRQACPTCAHVCDEEGQPHQLDLQTQDGEVSLNEPTYRCPTCKRAFFPSA